jgi:hypothetical protein
MIPSSDFLEPATSVKKACELTGKSRATVYRRRKGTRQGRREQRPAPPNALAAGELSDGRERLLAGRVREFSVRCAGELLLVPLPVRR